MGPVFKLQATFTYSSKGVTPLQMIGGSTWHYNLRTYSVSFCNKQTTELPYCSSCFPFPALMVLLFRWYTMIMGFKILRCFGMWKEQWTGKREEQDWPIMFPNWIVLWYNSHIYFCFKNVTVPLQLKYLQDSLYCFFKKQKTTISPY